MLPRSPHLSYILFDPEWNCLSKLRVELTDNGRLEVDENGTGNVLSGTSLAEECRERVVASALHLVRRHVAVGHDAVLHAVEFPASISDLDTGLANVDRNDFPLKKKKDASPI